MKNGISGFSSAEIFPFDYNKFLKHDFAPASFLLWDSKVY